MKFYNAYLKAVRANLTKGEITISFTVSSHEENLVTAQDLSTYADKEHGAVEVSIVPRQIRLTGIDEQESEF